MKIGILGLGLIGGSFVKAIRKYSGHSLFAANRSRNNLEAALSAGEIQGELNEETLPQCDLIILAAFPQACVDWVKQNAPFIRPSALVTDCCGVKEFVCNALLPLAHEYGFRFIGGHPMAGKARVGYQNADADLFLGASMILTPEDGSEHEDDAQLKGLFRQIGFTRFSICSPQEHDRIIAYTSQLTHILTNTYINSPTALKSAGFYGDSFRDLTRTAWLNETMWSELFLENRAALSGEMDALIARLAQMRDAIAQNDRPQLQALLQQGREMKEKADIL